MEISSISQGASIPDCKYEIIDEFLLLELKVRKQAKPRVSLHMLERIPLLKAFEPNQTKKVTTQLLF